MTVDVDSLIAELARAPEELLLEDRAAVLVHRAAKALQAISTTCASPSYLVADLKNATDIVRSAFEDLGHKADAAYARKVAERILSLSLLLETATATEDVDIGKLSRLEAALRPFANSDARHLPEFWRENKDTAVAGVCDFTYGDLIDAHKALYGEPRTFQQSSEGRSILPSIAKYGFDARGASPCPAILKPLEWKPLGKRGFVADAPLFGRIRIECYGSERFCVEYSVPGYSDAFVSDEFATADIAREAAQIEYERRMYMALVPDVVPVHRKVSFDTLALGARFRYREHDDRVWVKIGHNIVAKWDANLVADTWVGQSVCSFDEDDILSTTVYLVPEQGDVAAVPAPPASSVIADLLAKADPGPWKVQYQTGDPEEAFRGVIRRPQVNSLGHEVRSYVAQYCKPEHAELVAIAPQLAAEVLARRSSVGVSERRIALEDAANLIDRRAREYEEEYDKTDDQSVLRSVNLFAMTALRVGALDIRELATALGQADPDEVLSQMEIRSADNESGSGR